MTLGYACINMTLGDKKPKVTTNRTMRKKTFKEKGIGYVSHLALQNVEDLFKIVKWNKERNIELFRISSEIFPWASEYELSDLPDYIDIKNTLAYTGMYAKDNGIRLTTHPGPFNVLVSPRPHVVENTITDLTIHGELFDLLGLERSPYNLINIHCNGVYGDKSSAIDRFCENFKRLPESVQSRLTVENDDKGSMYSVKDLMEIHERTGIPIVFDYHHYKFNTGGQSEKEALELALSTWPDDVKPLVHYSESKSLHENDDSIKDQAHSDYINNLPNTYGHDIDVMVESKAKELAILPHLGKERRCEYSGLLSTEQYG